MDSIFQSWAPPLAPIDSLVSGLLKLFTRLSDAAFSDKGLPTQAGWKIVTAQNGRGLSAHVPNYHRMSLAHAYLVNGGASAPDWLRKGASKRYRDQTSLAQDDISQGVRLVQDSDFPEASSRLKTTLDGQHLVATGTYKPRFKVLDLRELAVKFERITDNETIDFDLLGSDWTKSLHLQANRTVELHDQRASYYKTRIPTPGRCVAYHHRSCDALFGASGGYVYRLNLEQGRFLTPLATSGHAQTAESSWAATSPQLSVNGDGNNDAVDSVQCIDINPAHQLLSLGTRTARGRGTVELWDQRIRSRVGNLRLPYDRLETYSSSSTGSYNRKSGAVGNEALNNPDIAVTALSSRMDGLHLAVGLSTGHTAVFDLRSPIPLALKDQGNGLPIKRLQWPSPRAAEWIHPLVASADERVVKIWHVVDDAPNLVSLNPPAPVNDMHIVPGTGLLWLANEARPLAAFFVPELGPAPSWCRFLENIADEDSPSVAPNSRYEDFKFIDRQELHSIGLDHLIGTSALRPYMHGFFIDLRLYTKARAIANPFEYAEYRDRQIAAKLDAERQSRIKISQADENHRFKVNAALIDRLRARDELKAQASNGKKRRRDHALQPSGQSAADGLVSDERFQRLFKDKAFEIDTNSREYALLNPNSAHQGSEAARRALDGLPADRQDPLSKDVSADEYGIGRFESSSDHSSFDDPASALSLRQSRMSIALGGAADATPNEASPPIYQRPVLSMASEDDRGTESLSATLGQRRRQQGDVKIATGSIGALTDNNQSFEGNRELSFIPDGAMLAQKKAEKRASRLAAKSARAQQDAVIGAGMHGQHAQAEEPELDSGRVRKRHVERSASKSQMRALTGR